MSKKWGKPNRSKRMSAETEAVPTPEEEEKKALAESSGTDGGYATKEEDEAAAPDSEVKEFEGEEAGEKPESEEEEEGEEHGEMKPEEKLAAEYKRKAQLAYHLGRGKAVMAAKALLPQKQKDALEECVHHKIPIIASEHEGMAQDQVEAIAFSVCWEKHFASITKDAADGDPLPGEEQNETVPIDQTSNKRPACLVLYQRLIEDIETELPGIEPADRQKFEDLLGQLRDEARQDYPDEDFGGEEDHPDISPEEARDFTDEVEDQYCRKPDDYQRRQRILYAKTMRILHRDNHHEIIKSAADHCHAMSEKALGYTMNKADKAMCKEHGRALDGIHGAVTAYMKKDEEEEPGEREMEETAGATENPEHTAPEPEGTDDEAAAVVEKLFAPLVEKSMSGTNGSGESTDAMLERLSALNERIFGTRL